MTFATIYFLFPYWWTINVWLIVVFLTFRLDAKMNLLCVSFMCASRDEISQKYMHLEQPMMLQNWAPKQVLQYTLPPASRQSARCPHVLANM